MKPKTLYAADGTPVVVDDLPDEAAAVVAATSTDVIPAEVAGFVVKWQMAPYPKDSNSTGARSSFS